ncbi:glycerophosphodiester phosphodiesterase family protein [Chelativorans sp. AA-79]|uniref:glycerophosphodiester phosphodiesterase family protein n=1 Tax=Chelativorans sp. AA-79 TaxID=3028735 RepID=UPI0023F99D59|nr:glycerophosphodiester phosphodiesterase family protein [Chelativorans sp. AA-79]WEX08040.1 glycerophosphodiester phosphodiesterase family protein [Chelativorans sp. AA-79]
MSDYVDFIADPKRGCAIAAHRGAWHAASENSVEAIENAIAAGYEIVEIDVRQSADGHLFLMHDETLERMAGRAEVAERLGIAELKAIRLREADGGEGRATTSATIPTLREALEVARGRIFVDLDLKDRDLMPRVITDVVDMGMGSQVDVKARVDSSEARQWLAGMGDMRGVPFMAMARFANGNAAELTDVLEAMAPFMCETKFDRIETIAERKLRFADARIAIWVNTLDPVSCCGLTDSAALADPTQVWGRLIDAGVSVIQTDAPEALQSYLRETGR